MKKSDKKQAGDADMIPKGPWPGAFGVYAYSKKIVEYNAMAFVPLIIISYILDLFSSFSSSSLVKALLYVVIILLELAGYVILFAALKHKKMSIAEALDKGTRLALKVLAVYIIVGVAVIIGLVALIIPGLIILPRLTMAPFYVIDQDMGVKEAIEASWKNSAGYSIKIWGVLAVQILFAALVLLIIGIYFSIIYTAALIVLYKYINANPIPSKE